MIKTCKYCGKQFEINSRFQNSKKYCSEQCVQAVLERKEQRRRKAIKPFASKRKCRDCLYYAPKWDGNRCDYMYLTDEKRGCPSGDMCTRYKKSTPSERSKYREKVMSKWENTFTHKIE